MSKKVNFKKIIFIAIIVLLLLFILLVGLTHYMVSSSFGRGDYEDYPTYRYDYEDYKKDYPRKDLEFSSGENKLKAFLYGENDTDNLLIFSHGLGSGHESYLNEITYMVDQGYKVFAYDATGSGASEGKGTKGLIQSALDLEAALSFIDSNEELKGLHKYLMGHSWGAFAVAEALAYRDDIVAVVSISGYAYPTDLLVSSGSNMAGFDLKGSELFFNISQMITFGFDNYRRNAIDSINSNKTPILLVHGTEDEMISYDGTSIIAHKGRLKNPNVKLLPWSVEKQNGHSNIFHPTEALDYIEKANEEFKKLMKSYDNNLPLEKRQEYLDGLDLDKLNRVNKELFDEILKFFEEAPVLK